MNLIQFLSAVLAPKSNESDNLSDQDEIYIDSLTPKDGQPYGGEMPTLSEQDPDWYKKQ